jgi:hypothetical protein
MCQTYGLNITELVQVAAGLSKPHPEFPNEAEPRLHLATEKLYAEASSFQMIFCWLQ